MKKLLFVLMLLPVFCNAQDMLILNSGDTLRGSVLTQEDGLIRFANGNGKTSVISQTLIKEIVTSKNQFKTPTAGSNLVSASNHLFAAVVINCLGTVVAVVSAVAFPPLAFVGGIITVVGACTYITAWIKIKRAGEILEKNNL